MTRLFFLLLLLALPVRAADPLDELINDQKKATEEWSQDAESVPEAMLWGEQDAVELFAPGISEGNVICQPLAFDELIELSRGDPKDPETVLNTDIPRVRELLQDTCLIAPKDPLIAIGAGWQKRVLIRDFVVRRDQPSCPQDSPYSLWARIDQRLTDAPVFYSTNDTWPEGGNAYVQLQESRVNDLGSDRTALAAAVKDLPEFDVWRADIHASNVESVYVLRRRIVELDDSGLPGEIILVKWADQIQELFMERIDAQKGSGHLRLEASLDYNGDGLADLVISGVHNACPYTLVFEGKNVSFSRANLPVKPCGCQ